MPVSANVLQDHLAYSAWASRRLLNAAGQLTPEELTRDFGASEKCVLRTLVHIFAADRIWLARISGQSPTVFTTDADYSMAVLENDWPALYAQWMAWAQNLTDAAAQQDLAYKDMRGNSYLQPAWKLVLHVVNHGTHHRGQVSGFLRAMGKTPPVLDLVAYYREQVAGA
jgi:uncharacterized damage-inducible protein DinB